MKHEFTVYFREPKVHSFIYVGAPGSPLNSVYILKSAFPDVNNPPKEIKVTLDG